MAKAKKSSVYEAIEELGGGDLLEKDPEAAQEPVAEPELSNQDAGGQLRLPGTERKVIKALVQFAERRVVS